LGFGAGVATALATAGVLAAGAPAQAATISSLHCESGGATLLCDVYYTSTGATQIRWWVNNVAQPAFDDRGTILKGCVVGRTYSVKVKVTDGSTDTRTRSVLCRAIWQ
jgi:hypothetical protein